MNEKERMPKVLVISHNVFSRSGNMGKSMKDILKALPAENLAQLYFHSERPTDSCCFRYFRITDTDVLKSVLRRRAGYKEFGEKDIDESAVSSRTDKGFKAGIYQFSRRRSPLIYLMRNLLWKLGKWDNKRLNEWISEFKPDVIFFASGDYAFSYKIVCRLADRHSLPVVTWCCDDFYINYMSDSWLGRLNHRNLMKWARCVISRSRGLVTISDKMAEDYSELLGIKAEVMRISAEANEFSVPCDERSGIVYMGNLGINRISPLTELGRALKKAAIPGLEKIDVYSGERNEKTLAMLTEDNGIAFHGPVPSSEVPKILGRAGYVVHVEAFDPKSKKRTMYSLSTKIGECLRSGACILAYGPKEISSIDYLERNNAACIIEDPGKIRELMTELESNAQIREKYVENAAELAEKCHNSMDNDKLILQILRKAM